MYIRELYLDLWQDQQADTQYQGKGSSHELASLLLTEVIQHSLFVSKQPVYLLALDAQSGCPQELLFSLTIALQAGKQCMSGKDASWDQLKIQPALNKGV